MNTQKSLLVQGWTGINHSYAMVNQYQLLALLNEPDLAVYKQEMPLFDTRWTKDKNGAGFSDSEQAALAAIPVFGGEALACVYKIHSPIRLAAVTGTPEINFLVTELGLDERNFDGHSDISAYVGSGGLIATPSQWSKERIVDYGFPADSVYVVPHGVDTNKFTPFSAEQRQQAREALGYTPDDIVFLNVGAPIWNKGLDVILQAFFTVRQTHKKVRLLIKDQQALYGLSSVAMIQNLAASGAITIDNESVESIRVLPQTVSIEQLRTLYNVADFYLSPYRAEGFNLPVIEAIACGTKAIVTQGGSTDDFCLPGTAIMVPSVKHVNAVIMDTKVGAYLQPDVDALVSIMRQCADTGRVHDPLFEFSRADMLQVFSWKRTAGLINALIPA